MCKFTFLIIFALFITGVGFAQSNELKLVFIRHGEKPTNGNSLSCQGLNRATQLPAVLYKKFGIPTAVFVPAMNLGSSTKNARMFQTITPFAVKYNLPINTSYDVDDKKGLADALLSSKGTNIITWEHNMLPKIIKALGLKGDLDWPDDDFDSIWIISFKNGKPIFTRDKEGLHPSANCGF